MCRKKDQLLPSSAPSNATSDSSLACFACEYFLKLLMFVNIGVLKSLEVQGTAEHYWLFCSCYLHVLKMGLKKHFRSITLMMDSRRLDHKDICKH